MARTSTIDRAQDLLALYRKHLPRHAAELVHSKMPASQREEALQRLRSGAIRIIVCVDMLGEGFDLPRLKIAGLHDRHRSEAVTLQFIGRFTRAEAGLGDATVVAGVSLEDPKEWLNALYKEDADWNTLLDTGSERRVEHQRRREELYTGLDADFEAIPAETVTPKLNTHVFRTHCNLWEPQSLERIETSSVGLVEGPIVNDELRLVMAVTRHEDTLRWTRVKHPTNVIYNLVMAHWDQEKELLYVHSYPEDGLVIAVAKLLCGTDVELLQGEAVFRVLHGFRRVMLTNLGVKETQVKPIRFQLSTGIDITEQLELTVENRSRIKTNLFGTGYVDEPVYAGDDVDELQAGKRSIGCSTKGKIWSQDGTVSPDDWIKWCQSIGPKIADDSINTDMVLRNVLRPKRQQDFPVEKIPISIDWPEGLSVSDEDRTTISFGEQSMPLSECDLEISAFEIGAPVRFRIRSAGFSAEFEADIRDGIATFRRRNGAPVTITRGKRTRDILDLFREDPPASFKGTGNRSFQMPISPEIVNAVEATRLEGHGYLDRLIDSLLERLDPAPAHAPGSVRYKIPTDEDCRDARNKVGVNLTPEGKEVLFRLLDNGAGYNSAGRRMSITQTAVKNRKKDWESAGGKHREKMFISYLDTVA
ncbi:MULTISPECIES: helicase-related protein [unclassified Mesorhizobium]|nr:MULTISPECIES: helicase-related protein [unclassified Mesorhizobium]WJI79425.1 hypothetical protein NLY34_21445 [Mesorhizobium sp. C374B]WJI85960.1 hypothetical protein NLY42_23840 [Mesorhizobium sp. C372A]